MLNKLIKLQVPNMIFLMETKLKYHEAIRVRDNSIFSIGFVVDTEEGEEVGRWAMLILA